MLPPPPIENKNFGVSILHSEYPPLNIRSTVLDMEYSTLPLSKFTVSVNVNSVSLIFKYKIPKADSSQTTCSYFVFNLEN